MFDNQGSADNMMNQQVPEGTAVYDAGGATVGTVGDQTVPGQYLVVQKGVLFPTDIYIPYSAIQRADAAGGVYLNLSKDDLAHQTYAQPPTMSAAPTGSGGRSTAPARTSATSASTPTRDTSDQIRVPLREEELVAGARADEIGQVHVHKDVVEEQQTVTVPVQREEVTVERVPVRGQATDVGPDAFTQQDIDVPVKGEEAVVGKQARVAEEVRLHKDVVTEQQQVSDTVRKERLTVEGADQVRGADNQTQ